MRTKTDDTNSASPIGVDPVPVKKLLSRQNDSGWWRTAKTEDTKKQLPASPGRKPSFRVTAHRTNSNGTKHRQAIKVTFPSRVAALATKFDSLKKPPEVKIVVPKSLLNGTLPRNVTLTTKPEQNLTEKKKLSARGSKVRQVVSNFEQSTGKTVQVKATPKPHKLILDAPPAVIKIGTVEKNAITQVPKDGSVRRKVAHKGDFRNGKTKKTEGRTLVVIDFGDGGNIDGEPNAAGITRVNIGKTDTKLLTNKSDALIEKDQKAESLNESKNLSTEKPGPFKKNGFQEVSSVESTTSASRVTCTVIPKKSFIHSQISTIKKSDCLEQTSVDELSVSDNTKLFSGLEHYTESSKEAAVLKRSKLYESFQKHSTGDAPEIAEPNKSQLHVNLQTHSTLEAPEPPDMNKSKLYGSLLKHSPVEEPGVALTNRSKPYGSLNQHKSKNSTTEESLIANNSKLHGSLKKHSTVEASDVPAPNKSNLHENLLKRATSEDSKSETNKYALDNTLKTSEKVPKSGSPPSSIEANSSFLWRKTSTPVPPSSPPPAEDTDRVYTAIPVMIDSEYDDVGPPENIYDDIGIHTRTSSADNHAEGYETCDGSTYDDCEGEGYQFVDGSVSRNLSDVDNVYDDVGVVSTSPDCDHDTETNYEAIDLKPRPMPLPMPPPVVAKPNSYFKNGFGRPGRSAPRSMQQSVGRHDSICSSASSSRSGSGEAGSYCEKINSIYGGDIPELGTIVNGTAIPVNPPSETSDEWVDVEIDTDNYPPEHNTFVVKADFLFRDQPRRRNGRWSRNVRTKWRSRQGPRVDTGNSSSDTDVENQYETLGEVKKNHVGEKIIFDGFDSFDSDSDDDRNFPMHTANLHVNVSHVTNGHMPSPPVRENIYGVPVMWIKEAAGKSMEKLKNWSLRKNDFSSRLNRMRRKSSVDPITATGVPENWSPQMEKSRSTTQITNSAKYFSFKKKWRRSSSASLAGHEVKSSTFYLTEVDICDKNGRTSPLYGGSTHADTASNISASSSTEGRSSPRSSPGGIVRRPFRPAPPMPPPPVPPQPVPPQPPNNLPERKTSAVVRPRSPPPPPPPPVPKRNNSREVEKDGKVNSPSMFYAECNLLESNGVNNSSDNDSSRKTSRQDESTNGLLSPYAAAGLYGGSQDGIHPSDMSDSSIGHNSSGSVKHLFSDEPLYQFYNVSIFEQSQRDQNNELDSDGYEEIVDGVLKPRPTAMELIRPKDGKHRTLWCEIPEVQNSHVLSTLTGTRKKLQEAKFEVITSEASYVKSLSVLEKHFIKSPELNDDFVIPKTDRQVLFAGIEPVRKKSESFLADLEKCWQHSIMLEGICKIVYEHAKDNFNVYTRYCTNQIYLDRTLRKLRDGGDRFAEALAKLESAPECQSLSLHSFLMLPMQRITRLPLLLDAVLHRLSEDSDEYNVCQLALASLNKIVANCNEGARKMERYEEMMRLSQQLKFPQDVKSIPIHSSNRWLVRSGALTQVCRKEDAKLTFGRKVHKVPLYLYLFSDILLVTKRKGDDSYSVIDYCPRNMLTIEILQQHEIAFLRSGEMNRHYLQFILLQNHENKTVEMILSCGSESDSKRWLCAVSPPQSENPGETLYETWDCPQVTTQHAYIARQPDELSLNVGDVVNVLRKLDDGWFEGERIRDCERGWFPGNHTVEVASSHVRAKNLKQRYRLLRLSASYLEQEKVNGK